MGKASKLKQIRKIASQLPQIMINRIEGNRATGEEVAASGVKEVDGNPIDPKGHYRQKKVVQQPINHNRKMKHLYNKMGGIGISAYLSAVKKHTETANA